jgi:polysaccharide biosynthesis transport protein
MTPDRVLGVLWQRRWLFLLTALVAIAIVVAVTLTLPKRYDATATLYVGERGQDSSLALDSGIAEELSRTYTTLAAQPSVADEVVRRLGDGTTRAELLNRMTFAPVERTQLLQLTARSDSPTAARDLANLYAQTFVSRVASSYDRSAAPTRITSAEPAVAPTEPAVPNVPLYLGFGVALALLLAAGTVLLRERLDDRLRVAPEDLELLDQPIVARIPAFDTAQTPGPAVRDAFRLLRANVDFSSEISPRIVGVSSSTPLEGKSTVAAQLALAAAHDGERVALIEADLRRPGLRDTQVGQGAPPAALGLTNYLAGGYSLDDVLSPHPVQPGLTLVWPGPLPPNPTRLLGSERLGHMLAELLERFDRVVVDTSPISVGADASIVLARVQGVLYVVDAARTHESLARSGLAQLATTHAPLLGVVVNRDGKPARDAYGYYVAGETREPVTPEPAQHGSARA